MSKQSDQSSSFSEKHDQPENLKTDSQQQNYDSENHIQKDEKQNKIKPLPKKDQNNEENQQDQENSQNEQKIWTKKYHWKDAFNEQSLKGSQQDQSSLSQKSIKMGLTLKQHHFLIKQELFDNPQNEIQETKSQQFQSGTQQIKKTKQFLRNDDLKIHKIKMETVIWSDERSKYELAEFVIKLIQNKRYYQRLSECSLRDRICLEIINHPNASENGKKQILKLFQEGVYLNPKVFSQYRIQDERKNQDQLITFCPSYYGTSTIFSQILKCINAKRMITGQYGFSKTFSTLLYSKLTNFIIDFRLNYQNKQKQSVYAAENRYKTFYLTFNLVKYKADIEKFGKINFDFIKQNCEQVKQLLQNGNIQQTDLNILQLYKKKGIKILLIFDQTNVLASLARQIIKVEKKQKQKSDEDILRQQIYKQFMSKYQKLRSEFNSIIFLTSINIDQQIVLRKLDLRGQHTHKKIKIISINFFKKQYQDQKNQQLIDFFIFEFGQRILQTQLTNGWHISCLNNLLSQRNKLRAQLYENFKKIYHQSYLSNLSISSFFQEQPQKYFEYQSINQLNLIEKSHQILKYCIYFSIKQFRQKIIFYLNENSSDKYVYFTKNKILTAIYIESQINCSRGEPQEHPQININIFENNQRKIIQKRLYNNTQMQLFQIIQKQNYQKYIKLYCSSGLLFGILKPLIEGIEEVILHHFETYFLKQNNKIVCGYQYEQMLINLLMIQNVKLKFKGHFEKSKYNFILNKAYAFETIPLLTNDSKQKDPFLEIKQYSLIRSLQNGINFLLARNNYKELYPSIICLPVKKDYKKEYVLYNEIQTKSKSIDFVILKLAKQKNSDKRIIEIHAVDASVAETMTYIRGKVYDFLTDFKNMKDVNRNLFIFQNNQTKIKQKIQIKLKYHIVGCSVAFKNDESNHPKKISDFIGENSKNKNYKRVLRKDLKENFVKRAKIFRNMKFQDEDYSLLKEISIIPFSKVQIIPPSQLTEVQKGVHIIYKRLLDVLKRYLNQ